MKITQHAKNRADERHGIRLTRDNLRYLNNCIKNGNYKLIKKQSNNRSKLEIMLNGKPIQVVYLKRSDRILTVL